MVTQIRAFTPRVPAALSGDTQLKPIRSRPVDIARPALECHVVHHVEGRVRLRVPRVQSVPGLAEQLRARLAHEVGIRSVRVNAACASIVVVFDPRRVLVDRLQHWVSSVVAGGAATARTRRVGPRLTRRKPEGVRLVGGLARGAAQIGPAAGVGAVAARAVLADPGATLSDGARPFAAGLPGSKLIEELGHCVELTDVLDLVCSAFRGDLRGALIALGLAIIGRYVRAAITRMFSAASREQGSVAPLALPVRRAAAAAA